jgi:hypothetical protein
VRVLIWVAISTVVYVTSLPLFFRLVHADHLTPAWLRAWAARLPLTLAALLLILGGTSS